MIKDEVYKFFADYIFKHSGILYTPNDYYRLEARVNTLIRTFNLETADQLFNLYAQKVTAEMHTALIDISTNNETYFLRDVKPFKMLVGHMLPEILKTNALGSLNIWSAGCSTGQEAYSMLMSIQEKSPEIFSKIHIDCTDISTKALSKTKNGNYDGLEIQRGLPVNLLVKYFTQNADETWTISDDLKRKLTTNPFNLLTDKFPQNKYHVIFCRNVLIYQNMENRKQILQNFYNALVPGGFLMLGTGESMIGLNLAFKQVTQEGSLFYQK